MGVHVHARACVCLWIQVNMCKCLLTCTYQARQMRMTDVSVFVQGCESKEGGGCVHDGEMLNRHGSTMTALWVSSFSPSLPSSLLPPHTFLKAQTLPVVTLEYCRPCWSTPLLGRRMSAQARGSFDKQSIYWYMIKYARNHPTAEGYYSFNIIIWINKHSVEK